MRRRGPLLAALLVLTANGIVLLHVTRNRAARLQEIELTERELPLAFTREENSGIDVTLTITQDWSTSKPGWLNEQKLRELGFELKPNETWNGSETPRPAFLALEYDGPAWQHYFEESSKKDWMKDSLRSASQLLPVDVSRDPERLRRRYSGNNRILIVRARIDFFTAKKQIQGSVTEIIGRDIHVPLPAASALENFRRGGVSQTRGYSIRLAYGAAYEPWVESIREITSRMH